MGLYRSSYLKNKITVRQLDVAVRERNATLFGDLFRVEKVEPPNYTRGKWCFFFQRGSEYRKEPDENSDAAFCFCLIFKNGTYELEFKIPPWRMMLEEEFGFDPQDRLRRSLVRKLNKGEE